DYQVPSPRSDLPPTEKWVDERADAFEEAWRGARDNAGVPPRIQDFLGAATGRCRQALLRELVKIDAEWRWGTEGQRSLGQYVDDIPEMREGGAGAMADLVEHFQHRAARQGPVSAAQGPTAGPPTIIGRYVVLSELGDGGQGRVYRAYDPVGRREVAVK